MTSVLLAAVMLIGFFSLPRPQAISSMPWKAELVAALCSIFLAFTRRKAANTTVRNICLVIGGFTLWSALSVIWAPSTGWAVHHTLLWAAYGTIFFVIVTRVGNGIEDLLNAFAIVALILFVSAAVDLASIDDFMSNQGTIRIRYGKFAEMMATVAPVLAAGMIYLRGKRIALAAIGWIASWSVVMMSLSKGAFIAGLAGHILFFSAALFFTNRSWRKRVAIAGLAFVAYTVAFQLAFSLFTPIPSTTDYISGAADKTRETSVFRTFVWKVGAEMVTMHPLLGFGADNFGVTVNEGRASLAAKGKVPPGIEIAEDQMIERAHNEPLQVSIELGLPGLLLFVGIFFAVGVAGFRKFRLRNYQLSTMYWGTVGGALAFAISSLVSSFSFRAAQNGVVLFAVLAINIREITKHRNEKKAASRPWATIVCVIAGVSLLAFTTTKAIGDRLNYQAEQTLDIVEARSLYERSLALDPDNAYAYYFYANRLGSQAEDPAAAAVALQKGIDRGIGVTATYSKLAQYLSESGRETDAIATLEKAVSIFPHSVFIRVRYALELEKSGNLAESERQMKEAVAVDARQAAGWKALLTVGSVRAFYGSEQDPNVAAPKELLPANAVLDFIDKDSFPKQ